MHKEIQPFNIFLSHSLTLFFFLSSIIVFSRSLLQRTIKCLMKCFQLPVSFIHISYINICPLSPFFFHSIRAHTTPSIHPLVLSCPSSQQEPSDPTFFSLSSPLPTSSFPIPIYNKYVHTWTFLYRSWKSSSLSRYDFSSVTLTSPSPTIFVIIDNLRRVASSIPLPPSQLAISFRSFSLLLATNCRRNKCVCVCVCVCSIALFFSLSTLLFYMSISIFPLSFFFSFFAFLSIEQPGSIE